MVKLTNLAGQYRASGFVSACIAGPYVDEALLARFLPSWIPGLKFHEYAKKGKEMYDQIRYWAFSQVKLETVSLEYLCQSSR